MYKVLEYFTDLKDNSYEYHVGSIYPREGYRPSDERIEELATNKNVRKRPLIVKDEDNTTVSNTETVEKTAEDISEVEEKPKKRGKKRDE